MSFYRNVFTSTVLNSTVYLICHAAMPVTVTTLSVLFPRNAFTTAMHEENEAGAAYTVLIICLT